MKVVQSEEARQSTMRVLLATGAPALPQMIGGSQRSGDTLLRGLAARGHLVATTAALVGNGWLGWRGRLLMKTTRQRAVVDRKLGYPTYRSWFPAETVDEVVRRFRPDVAIVQAHSTDQMGRMFYNSGVPVLFSFQDVEFQDYRFDLRELGPIRAVANSRFTADTVRKSFAADCTVIHPMIDLDRYRTQRASKNEGSITFINPDPRKGLDVALAVAALLPEVPFRVQETWPMRASERQALLERLQPLTNVTLAPQVEDMREVYRRTRILLAPSQWNEGYGRIATEAQCSGIPVVGSDRGGLPEAIGEGGMTLPAEAPAHAWAAALRKIWDDDALYDELGAKALAHSARASIQLPDQLSSWEKAISAAARF